MTQLYNADVAVNSDACWMNAKDMNNDSMGKYALYYNDSAHVKKPTGTLPDFSLEHPNLRGRPGYGVSDDYLIDIYSSLRNNASSMTRDRCPIQLITRTFAGGPRLTGKTGDIDKELDVLSGSDTRVMPVKSNVDENTDIPVRCNKAIMELPMNNFMPLLDCIKEVQNPENIVPNWIRGGEDTRSYINKVKYTKCPRKQCKIDIYI